MSENVVVYFFKVGKRQGLERLFGTSKAFITLYDRSRGWAKGEGWRAESTSVYRCYKLWVLRFWQQGSAPGVAIPETGKSEAPFFEDSVRQTPQPVPRLVSLTDNEVSYLDWVAGLCPVLAPRDGSSHW